MESRRQFGNGEGAGTGTAKSDPFAHARQNHTKPAVAPKPVSVINAVTGSLSLSLPIYTSAGRSGFGPSLSLTYDSSLGNGVFGLGWGLGVESITRKTSKRLPQYHDLDANAEGADTFMAAGMDDLVPGPAESEVLRDGWKIRRYQPRTLSETVRVEKWTRTSSDGDAYWRIISADNVTTIFGRTDESRVFDPAGPANGGRKRIFSWLISERYDANGNAVRFKYKPEDSIGVNTAQDSYEVRTNSHYAQRYLKSILYGNRVPNRHLDSWAVDPSQVPDDGWLFEVVMDYGEHDISTPTTVEAKPWQVRRDPFSLYNSGFEIRTYRLCRQVLMFHHVPAEFDGVQDVLVSSTTFEYDESSMPSGIPLLTSMITSGHAPDKQTESLPPVTFEYTTGKEPRLCIPTETDCPNLKYAAAGLLAGHTEWLDFRGEGSTGFLSRNDDACLYQRNESAASSKGSVYFGEPTLVSQVPIAPGRASSFFADLNHSGRPGLVCGVGEDDKMRFPTAYGYYEQSKDGSWLPFAPFSSSPNVDLLDARVRMADMTGDGRPDAIRFTGDTGPGEWYPSLGIKGFGGPLALSVQGPGWPSLPIGDPGCYVYMADMTGDGLADIVQIRNGSVTYWPNQGYGHFGACIQMGNSPRIDQFTHERLRLADITGSGTTDLIYLPPGGGASVYYNRAGNRWSDKQFVPLFPELDSIAIAMVIDLLGQGTACLCWVSPCYGSPQQGASGILNYIDFMGGQKPGLLRTHRNGSGLERSVSYAPSTKFYLNDECAGDPWKTRLPFPVQCVERFIETDRITKSKATTSYAYHNGYYDMLEREFRGFGVVEQWHEEAFPISTDPNNDTIFRKPPTRLKTWFHLGMLRTMDDPSPVKILRDSEVDLISSDAYRALKGLPIREELYGDGHSQGGLPPHLYQEDRYEVHTIQGCDVQGQGVYRVVPREHLKSYPKNGGDSRLLHDAVLQVNDYGRVTKSVSIAYGKKTSTLKHARAKAKQEETVISYTEADYTNAIDSSDDYRLPQSCETRKYRVSGAGISRESLLTYSSLIADDFAFFRCAANVDFEDEDLSTSGTKALVARERVLYRASDLSTQLPCGKLEPYSVIDQTFQLAITPKTLVEKISKVLPGADRKAVEEILKTYGGYVDVDQDHHWWIPSGYSRYAETTDSAVELSAARSGFYIPTLHIDQFMNHTRQELDTYGLLAAKITDSLQNSANLVYDYVALQAKLFIDPNGNRRTVVFDALRRVVGEAVAGQVDQNIGDSLDGFQPQLTEEEMKKFKEDPESSNTRLILKQAGTRYIYSAPEYMNGTWSPAFQATISRDEHLKDTAQLGIEIVHLSGSGEPIQTATLKSHQKWRCSGRTLCDSKGLPVRKFFPYFSNSYTFHSQPPLPEAQLFTTIFRDPLDRELGTLNADNTWCKVRNTPWTTEKYDTGDTVLIEDPTADADVGASFRLLESEAYLPSWYDRSINGGDAQQKAAALKSRVYSETPTVAHKDSLGRTIVMVDNNGANGKYTTLSEYDMLGNLSRVTNARGIVVSQACYDMCAREVYRVSSDSGERCMLHDCLGRTMLVRDARNIRRRFSYDALGRIVAEWITEHPQGPEIMGVKMIYGESRPDARDHNLRMQLYQRYDKTGVAQNNEFDFKGNCLESQIQLAKDYKSLLDWSGAQGQSPELEPTIYKNSAELNARNQAHVTTSADGSRISRTYNIGGELQTLSFHHYAASHLAPVFINAVDYTPDGKREKIVYGNSTTKINSFNTASRQLERSQVKREATNRKTLRDVIYTHDCCGRVTNVHDAAAQAIYFANNAVQPTQSFTYDAIGQIVEAHGREQIDVSHGHRIMRPYTPSGAVSKLPGDGTQMCEYVETYRYDSVGNITALVHGPAKDTSVSGWTRRYNYEETCDRLSSTTIGNTSERYGYDEQGCMSSLDPYYTSLSWDYNHRLRSSSSQVVKKDGVPETTWYVYDGKGQRVRKVTERSVTAGGSTRPTRLKETIYLPGYQIYRTYKGDGRTIKHEFTTSLVLDSHGDSSGAAVALVEYNTISKVALVRYQAAEALELDDQAAIVSYSESSPFGAPTYHAVGSNIQAPRKYRFAAYERDTETGMDHCGERYYASWLGRWSSPDPIGLADGVNRYRYVRNDPLNLTDGNGMMFRVGRGREDHRDGQRPPAARDRSRSPIDRWAPTGGLKIFGDPIAIEGRVHLRREAQRSQNQVFGEGMTDSSAQFHLLERTPLTVAIQGLIGCTALILVSHQAVYFAHFWEHEGGFDEYAAPNVENALSTTFSQRVLGSLEHGGRWIPSLQQRAEHFTGDEVRGFIMTPTETLRGAQPTYPYNVQQIQETVDRMVPGVAWDMHLYDPEAARVAAEEQTVAGKALVEYHPGPPAKQGSRSRGGRNKRLRVMLEGKMWENGMEGGLRKY
ncbi:65kDa B protein-domain-containing protein [Nemania sp. FL0916]|nr:65kDa B protein-domain-containing protein [Nemania sp. FL0916]